MEHEKGINMIKHFIRQELKDKYNYSDELLDILDKLYPAFIDYYGEEYMELIHNTFINTKIIQFNETNYNELINKKYGLDESDCLLKQEAGHLLSVFTKDFKEIKVIRVWDKNEYESTYEYACTIAHELIHALMTGKNKINKITPDNNTSFLITNECGFEVRYETLYTETENNFLESIGSTSCYDKIEEGFTENDARIITEKAYNLNHKIRSNSIYDTYVDYVKQFSTPVLEKIKRIRINHQGKHYLDEIWELKKICAYLNYTMPSKYNFDDVKKEKDILERKIGTR
jgi:hypothetical protein